MLKAVIFDIDDTLYSYQEANKRTMERMKLFVMMELGIPMEEFEQDYHRLMQEQIQICGGTSGRYSRAIRFQRMMEERGLPLRYGAQLNDLYWEIMMDEMTPAEGAAQLLDGLRERGLRLGVGSDMTADWQIKKLDKLGLLDKLDFIVTSEEAGVEKPELKLFQLCAKKAGCAMEECLFIGDNLKKDVLGALNAGMDAVWVQPEESLRAEHPNVKSVSALKELIEHILR
jgi:putative hydrolase of the HAD superfamily